MSCNIHNAYMDIVDILLLRLPRFVCLNGGHGVSISAKYSRTRC